MTQTRFVPEKIGGSDIWYIASSRKAFTPDPEMAAKTGNGCPIAAPGEAMRISGVMMDNLRQLWEHLLDEMEKLYAIAEKKETMADQDPFNPESRHAQYESEIKVQEAKIRGLVDALAILEYGWTFKHEPENARSLVVRQAEVRYNMSVEE